MQSYTFYNITASLFVIFALDILKIMKLNGRRFSNNVDDRRGLSGRTGLKLGGGIGAVVIAALIAWLSGGNPLSVISGLVGDNSHSAVSQPYQPTPQEQELADFSRKILAGTEDVWTEQFQRLGLTYEPPKMVLYSGSTTSGCGTAQSSMGPFYCSADRALYIDLSFFSDMRRTLGADGDFAYAYVIAHEVGHHVQYLLGTLDEAHSQMSRMSEAEANRMSVRLELQADYLAGVWAHHDNRMFGSIEPGDIDEALDAARKIGDDYLQQQARGYVVPETFNHGTSAQRHRWLNLGLRTGDLSEGNTFSVPYDRL